MMNSANTIASMNAGDVLPIVLSIFVGIPLLVLAIIYLVIPFFKGIGWFVRHIFRFVIGMISDSLRFVGTIFTTLVLVPLTVGSILIGRWSASAHYGRAVQSEFKTAGRSLYRVCIGHPARLLCLSPLLEGLENRIPKVIDEVPGSDRPSKRMGQFEGYTITGSLKGGGSGAKLYVANPSDQKLAAFAKNGEQGVDQVVIKAFSLGEGSSLPQIVRENRSLDAAKRLGLILEHDLTNERFHYVMRYMPGKTLTLVAEDMHAQSGGGGLGLSQLRQSLEFTCDLLRTLGHYHSGGLWHKDVKPDNVIVSDNQAHLVDFGLITPLRSSMTLTTHGTEYYRDPDMVRLALKGVKVQDVDGAKFDIYAVGSVLYYMIEKDIPAHGGLSNIRKNCPETVRMIVRRAMTDYDKRYATAWDMLQDVEAVLSAQDPNAMKVIALPSMRGAGRDEGPAPAVASAAPVGGAAVGAAAGMGAGAWGTYAGAGNAAGQSFGAGFRGPGSFQTPSTPPDLAGNPARPATPAGRIKPRLRVTSWWCGKYVVEGQESVKSKVPPASPAPSPTWGTPLVVDFEDIAAATPARGGPASRFRGASVPAKDQLSRARQRAHAARDRIRAKARSRNRNYASGMNVGVGVAVLVFLGAVGAAGIVALNGRQPQKAPMKDRSRVVMNTTNSKASRGLATVDATSMAVNPAIKETSDYRDGRKIGQKKKPITMDDVHTTHVMVICDWSKLGDRNGVDASSAVLQLGRLQSAGFILHGDAPPDITKNSGDTDMARAAEARAAIGTNVFLSNSASIAITQWLDRSDHTADDAALVVWIGPEIEPNTGSRFTTWLIAQTDLDPNITNYARKILSVDFD